MIKRKQELEREIIALKESPETRVEKGGKAYLNSLKAEWNEVIRELTNLAPKVNKKFMSLSEHTKMAKYLLSKGVTDFGNIFNSQGFIDELYNKGYSLLTLQRIFNDLKSKLKKGKK